VNFEETIEIVKERICLDELRARSLYKAAEEAVPLDGEFWECGVYKGGSARMLAELLRAKPRPLRLFDTFAGFSGVIPEDGIHNFNGRIAWTDIEDVRKFVDADFLSIYVGAIPSGFAGLEDSRIAFANVDVDLYHATKEALKFILPRMVKGGIVIIDDCGDPDYPGVGLAVAEIYPAIQVTQMGWGRQGRINL
jgi:O-methyltransferase